MKPIQHNVETDYDTNFPPCPGCGEGMVFFPEDTKQQEGAGHYECCYCGWSAPFKAGIGAAYARAMKRYVEPNRILSAEDLALMEGEPVFVQQGDGDEFWAMIEDGKPIIGECDRDFQNMTMSPPLHDPDGHFGLHVLGWRALKRRPTDAERKAAKWEAQP